MKKTMAGIMALGLLAGCGSDEKNEKETDVPGVRAQGGEETEKTEKRFVWVTQGIEKN